MVHGDDEAIDAKEMKIIGGSMELSLSSVVGLTSQKTVKVKGTIVYNEVVMLIDCGATHNFISVKLM